MPGHSGHRQRVKTEFLARGVEGWSDHRILELLLFYAIPQGDVNELAHRLEHTAVLLKLVPAIGGRYQEQRGAPGQIIHSPEEAAAVLSPYFFGAANEMVYILCLDGKGKVLGVRKVSEGSIYASDINIRRIAEAAMSLRSAGLYLAHNHISNLAFPSAADWQTTDVIRSALAGVGLELIDHLIFVDGDVLSLNQSESGGHRPVYELL